MSDLRRTIEDNVTYMGRPCSSLAVASLPFWLFPKRTFLYASTLAWISPSVNLLRKRKHSFDFLRAFVQNKFQIKSALIDSRGNNKKMAWSINNLFSSYPASMEFDG